MAEIRWGSRHVWGDGSIWGGEDATAPYRAITWIAEIDWTDTGEFDGTNEAVHMYDFKYERGRKYMINSSGTGYERIRPGTASLYLRNLDGRYSQDNVSSPLYPNMMPGKMARVRVYHEDTDTIYPVFAGRVSSIKSVGANEVLIELVEDLILTQASVYIPLQNLKTADECVALVVAQCNWPAFWGAAVLGASPDEILYWWCDGESAGSAIGELEDADRGVFFQAADGKAVYVPGDFGSPAAVMELIGTDVLEDISIPTMREVVRNRIQIRLAIPVVNSLATVWQSPEATGVSAGETIYVWVKFTDANGKECPATGLVDPVATTDYTANSLIGGGGTDLTASFDVSISATYAKSALLKITNNHGSLSGYLISGYKLRGQTITTPGDTIVRGDNLVSQQLNGIQSLDMLSTSWIQNRDQAESMTTRLLTMLSDSGGFPTFKIRGNSTKQFLADLFDVVHINIDNYNPNLDRHLRLSYISQKWIDEIGGIVETTMKFEPFFDLSGYWQFDVQIGIDSIFAP